MSAKRVRLVQSASPPHIQGEALTIKAMRKGFYGQPNPARFMEEDYLHVSDIIHQCLRKISLHKIKEIDCNTEYLSDTQAITFRIGVGIHDFVIDRMKRTVPEELYGRWSCSNRHVMELGTYADISHRQCETCGQRLDQYNEYMMRDDGYKLTGSIDLMRKIDDHFFLTEIKSISGKGFEQLSSAHHAHIIQILLYWHMANRMGLPVYDTVSIVYIRKEYSFKNVYKEFTLHPRNMEAKIAPYLSAIVEYNNAIHTGSPVPRTICSSINTSRAKDCELCQLCFSEG